MSHVAQRSPSSGPRAASPKAAASLCSVTPGWESAMHRRKPWAAAVADCLIRSTSAIDFRHLMRSQESHECSSMRPQLAKNQPPTLLHSQRRQHPWVRHGGWTCLSACRADLSGVTRICSTAPRNEATAR